MFVDIKPDEKDMGIWNLKLIFQKNYLMSFYIIFEHQEEGARNNFPESKSFLVKSFTIMNDYYLHMLGIEIEIVCRLASALFINIDRANGSI